MWCGVKFVPLLNCGWGCKKPHDKPLWIATSLRFRKILHGRMPFWAKQDVEKINAFSTYLKTQSAVGNLFTGQENQQIFKKI